MNMMKNFHVMFFPPLYFRLFQIVKEKSLSHRCGISMSIYFL
jgi:hypothetical protein